MASSAHNKIKVGLVQINNSFSGQNYFPYSAGVLQAYAKKNIPNIDDYEFLLPVYSRIPVSQAVDQLIDADVVGFSIYVWNARISWEIAEELKKRKPGILIFFGGPHVPDRVDDFLKKRPYIDIACHGEGEQVFAAILTRCLTRDWKEIPSISYIDTNGSVVTTTRAERLRDLSQVPSPYLEGTFEPLMRANPNEHWIAMWETNRGCPFSCTFCDWGSAVAAKVNYWDMGRLTMEIDWFARHKIEYIFCADANFGIVPRDVEIARYCTETKKKTGFPHAMSVQNTKNATERSYEVQKMLSDAGLNKGVVLSLQSIDMGTLKSIKRDNISLDSYHTIQKRFAAQGIETMSDLILGLPGETYESFADGVSTVIDNGQHNRIQFNNLSVLPNAEMGDPAYQKKYGMEIIENQVVNIHGELIESNDEIHETQELVIATASMPHADWARTRAFCWMAGLLHFDKVLQIPMIVVHRLSKLSYRELFELFSEGRFRELAGDDEDSFPVLSEVRDFFMTKAEDIQNGGMEYCHSKDWLNIWWPADEYILIKLCKENKLDAFYREAERAFLLLLKQKGIDIPELAVHEAIELNRSLVKIPFQTRDLELTFTHNIWEFYRSAILGTEVILQNKRSRYHIDRTHEHWDSWDDWCRKVVWWGNKKGAYLYGNVPVEGETQLAGHF